MRIFIIFIAIFISCNSNQEQEKALVKEEKPGDSANNTIPASVETCYWQIMQRDTLVTSLEQNGTTITGKLTFDNFQKDGSSGTVKGKMEGDTIKLWYSFQSEGMHSVMEVWYRKAGDALLRGVGPSAVKKDTSYFTDHTAITFDADQRLEKVNCSELPEKYK